jgi:hypothetical protein
MLKKAFLACAVILSLASTASGAVVAYVLQTPGVV